VLEGLIERELLAAEARRLGLTVSEEEVSDSIYHGFVHVSLPSDNLQLQQNLGIADGKIKVGFQDPKTKQPMFELQHVKGDSHTMVGVFKKGEPKSPPFVINNNTVTDITPDQIKATKDDIKNLKGKPGDLDREAGHRLLMQRVFREAGNPGPSQSAPTYAETETKWRKAAGVD
jgi:hypothetical protein